MKSRLFSALYFSPPQDYPQHFTSNKVFLKPNHCYNIWIVTTILCVENFTMSLYDNVSVTVIDGWKLAWTLGLECLLFFHSISYIIYDSGPDLALNISSSKWHYKWYGHLSILHWTVNIDTCKQIYRFGVECTIFGCTLSCDWKFTHRPNAHCPAMSSSMAKFRIPIPLLPSNHFSIIKLCKSPKFYSSFCIANDLSLTSNIKPASFFTAASRTIVYFKQSPILFQVSNICSILSLDYAGGYPTNRSTWYKFLNNILKA